MRETSLFYVGVHVEKLRYGHNCDEEKMRKKCEYRIRGLILAKLDVLRSSLAWI
jgi:hypothetical protein